MNRFLGIFAIFVLAAMPSFAQFDTAEVLGTVRDPSGAFVPKAAVTLLNVDTGIWQIQPGMKMATTPFPT